METITFFLFCFVWFFLWCNDVWCCLFCIFVSFQVQSMHRQLNAKSSQYELFHSFDWTLPCCHWLSVKYGMRLNRLERIAKCCASKHVIPVTTGVAIGVLYPELLLWADLMCLPQYWGRQRLLSVHHLCHPSHRSERGSLRLRIHCWGYPMQVMALNTGLKGFLHISLRFLLTFCFGGEWQRSRICGWGQTLLTAHLVGSWP